MTQTALESLLVREIGDSVAGAYAGKLFADYGSEVHVVLLRQVLPLPGAREPVGQVSEDAVARRWWLAALAPPLRGPDFACWRLGTLPPRSASGPRKTRAS